MDWCIQIAIHNSRVRAHNAEVLKSRYLTSSVHGFFMLLGNHGSESEKDLTFVPKHVGVSS